jgi:lysophospholipase L1-like esterase
MERKTDSPSSGGGKKVVACLGSSSTAAKGSFNWIGALEQRPHNTAYRFYNFGVGGDLAYNGLERLKDVIDCHPDIVIIHLGGNDVLTSVSKKMLWFLRRWKHIPADPSPAWYRENMLAIIRRIKTDTKARIAICSLQPIGEDPASSNPFQAEINRLTAEYNAVIRQIAREENAYYIPFYERMQEQIQASPGKAFTAFNFLPFYYDAFEQFILRRSLDDISRRNGWTFHIDGVHLNSRGGNMLVDLVQKFLDS